MSKGKTSIKKSDVKFFEVLEHDIFQKNRKENKDLSDFEARMLELVGNAIRPRESQHFWSDGCYSWYRNGRKKTLIDFGSPKTESSCLRSLWMMTFIDFSESGLTSDLILPIMTDREKLIIN